MDPSKCLPRLCMDQIFSFFNGKELLTLMTVSKNWHHIISTSTPLMSKLRLTIYSDWLDDFKILKIIINNSDRPYSHLRVSMCDPIMGACLNILSHPARHWKSVDVYLASFRRSEQIKKFFGYFEKTVTSLTLNQIALYDDKEVEFKHFKKLEKLAIFYVDSIVYKAIFKAATNLRILDLSLVDSCTVGSAEGLRSLSKLKELYLNSAWLICLLGDSDFSNVKFQLEELNMKTPYDTINDFNDEINGNFLKFLQTQKRLRKIHFLEWHGFAVLNQVLEMPTLKELILEEVPQDGWEFNYVAASTSLDTLDIRRLYVEPVDNNLRELLLRTPNLKHIKLRFINESIAIFISQHMTQIETISVVHGIRADIRDFLPNRVRIVS